MAVLQRPRQLQLTADARNVHGQPAQRRSDRHQLRRSGESSRPKIRAGSGHVIAKPTDLDSYLCPGADLRRARSQRPGRRRKPQQLHLRRHQKRTIFVTFTGGGGVGNIWNNISNHRRCRRTRWIPHPGHRRRSHARLARRLRGHPERRLLHGRHVGRPHAWVNITGAGSNSVSRRPIRLRRPDADREAGQVASPRSSPTGATAIPDNPALSNSPTHPVLYVAGDSGVYRSLDKGANLEALPQPGHRRLGQRRRRTAAERPGHRSGPVARQHRPDHRRAADDHQGCSGHGHDEARQRSARRHHFWSRIVRHSRRPARAGDGPVQRWKRHGYAHADHHRLQRADPLLETASASSSST